MRISTRFSLSLSLSLCLRRFDSRQPVLLLFLSTNDKVASFLKMLNILFMPFLAHARPLSSSVRDTKGQLCFISVFAYVRWTPKYIHLDIKTKKRKRIWLENRISLAMTFFLPRSKEIQLYVYTYRYVYLSIINTCIQWRQICFY